MEGILSSHERVDVLRILPNCHKHFNDDGKKNGWSLFSINLYVLNFSEETKTCIYILCNPQWQDTGSWNPSSSKTRTYLFTPVNIIVADVLVMQGAGASIFTLLNRIDLVPAC